MSRWLPFAAVALAILLGGVGAFLWLGLTSETRCETYTEVDLETLPDEPVCVRLRAQAHYDVVLTLHSDGTPFTDPVDEYLFPLFPPDQLDERGIRVLVRTARAPERLVNVETMTLQGQLRPLTPAELPIGAEAQLGRVGGYFFEDFAMLLVPDQIRSGDEVWPQPGQE